MRARESTQRRTAIRVMTGSGDEKKKKADLMALLHVSGCKLYKLTWGRGWGLSMPP